MKSCASVIRRAKKQEKRKKKIIIFLKWFQLIEGVFIKLVQEKRINFIFAFSQFSNLNIFISCSLNKHFWVSITTTYETKLSYVYEWCDIFEFNIPYYFFFLFSFVFVEFGDETEIKSKFFVFLFYTQTTSSCFRFVYVLC